MSKTKVSKQPARSIKKGTHPTAKIRAHFIEQSLLRNNHPLNVFVVGCGGTGTYVLQHLTRLHVLLKALGRKGLHITVFDPDIVTSAIVGRQLYSHGDIGRYKAEVSIERINRFYGTRWEFINTKFDPHGNTDVDFLISSTDSIKSRLEIESLKNNFRSSYWIDCGNGKDFGQIIMGTFHKIEQPKKMTGFYLLSELPLCTFVNNWDKSTPEPQDQQSCSIVDSFRKQDLMINPIMACYAVELIWRLLDKNFTTISGYYINMNSVIPIEI